MPAIWSAATLPANGCDPTVVGIHGSQRFATIRAQDASKGSYPDRMEWLRELIRGKRATVTARHREERRELLKLWIAIYRKD